VLLADRQTTGGYPKIATVISADLPALGRVPIGARIAFAPVTLEAAEQARRALFAEIETLADKILPIEEAGADITPRLFDRNLIGGVVDAHLDAHTWAS
jgi:allophanate hydrolase